jgi:hypothetical protein
MSAAFGKTSSATLYAIAKGKPLPVSKAKKEADERTKRIFREYCDAYERLYVRRPESFTVDPRNGMLRVSPGGEVMSLKRMKQLTRNMNDRVVSSK